MNEQLDDQALNDHMNLQLVDQMFDNMDPEELNSSEDTLIPDATFDQKLEHFLNLEPELETEESILRQLFEQSKSITFNFTLIFNTLLIITFFINS